MCVLDSDHILRVAFLEYWCGLGKWGIAKYCWYLTNELRKLGVHVDVFTTNFHPKTLGPPFFYAKNFFLKLRDYDLIHSDEGAAMFVNHPRIVETFHHDYKQTYDFNSLIFSRLEALECHKARHIIVPSFMTKNSLIDCGFSENRISVIHHGVDHHIFKKNYSSRFLLREKYGISNSFVVINVGQLIRRKRQIDIIKALQGIPNTVFILVGSGGEQANINSLAEKLGVKVLYFKHVSESLLVDLYNVADVYVHTSILEGFGLTMLEALACGLPVVAYRTADWDQLIGNAGILVEVGDIEGIRSVLLSMRENPGMRDKMGEAALFVSKSFSWSETARKHLQVYQNVMKSY
jgi:glycosyltransferase involved in cell wall biosynthesis